MSKGWKNKSQKAIEQQIAELELKKRNGIIKIVGAIAAFILIAVVHTWIIMSSNAEADNVFIRGLVYVSAMVCAGFAGYGTRDVYRASNAIRDIRLGLSKKSKKK